MANIKLIHTDSNSTRANAKAEREAKLNEQLSQIKTNLRDTKAYKIFNQTTYEALVIAIEALNVNHLTNLDVFSLVEVSNTMHLIEELNDTISKFDEYVEYNERLKTIASRSALLNTLDKQLTALQLSPAQRNALLLETQTNMNAISFSDDEFEGILKGLDGIQ